jgi:hypothetical protein
MAVLAVKRGARLRIRTSECRPRSQVSMGYPRKLASFADGALASVATVSTAVRGRLKAAAEGHSVSDECTVLRRPTGWLESWAQRRPGCVPGAEMRRLRSVHEADGLLRPGTR